MNSSVLIIAVNTFRELVRGKVLYASLFVFIFIVALSALFGSVSVGDQLLVVKDFGLFSISLSSVIFAVITGASLLHKELERKTIFNILSKPVSRWEFVLGKFSGMYLTQLIYVFMSSLMLSVFTSFYNDIFDFKLIIAGFFIALELSIISAATVFFASLVVTPALNGLFSFGFFLMGRSVDYLKSFIEQNLQALPAPRFALESLYYILPHLDKLNVADQVVFGQLISDDSGLSLELFAWSALYSFSYSAILLLIASFLFSKREFN